MSPPHPRTKLVNSSGPQSRRAQAARPRAVMMASGEFSTCGRRIRKPSAPDQARGAATEALQSQSARRPAPRVSAAPPTPPSGPHPIRGARKEPLAEETLALKVNRRVPQRADSSRRLGGGSPTPSRRERAASSPRVSAGREACRVGVGRARGSPSTQSGRPTTRAAPIALPAPAGGRRGVVKAATLTLHVVGGRDSESSGPTPPRHPRAARPSSNSLGLLTLLSQALSVVHPETGRRGDPAFSPLLRRAKKPSFRRPGALSPACALQAFSSTHHDGGS